MVKKKSYSKESDKVKVEQELKETSPIVVRFHKQGCPACQMSQPAWDEFSRGMEPTMYRIVEIEENAIPPNILAKVFAIVRQGYTPNCNNNHIVIKVKICFLYFLILSILFYLFNCKK